MLVITRHAEESVEIMVQGTPIYIRVLQTRRGMTSLGIQAPREWNVRRTELPLDGALA